MRWKNCIVANGREKNLDLEITEGRVKRKRLKKRPVIKKE